MIQIQTQQNAYRLIVSRAMSKSDRQVDIHLTATVIGHRCLMHDSGTSSSSYSLMHMA